LFKKVFNIKILFAIQSIILHERSCVWLVAWFSG